MGFVNIVKSRPRNVDLGNLANLTEEMRSDAERLDRDATFPGDNFRRLAGHGLIGLTVAENAGGGGAGIADALRVLAAVAKGEPSTALILFMTYGYHLGLRHRPSRPIEDRLAREAAAGRGLLGVLRVEPELGTPVRGGIPKTRLRRQGDRWMLDGTKIYATGSTGLDWFVVWAATDEEHPRVGNVLVPATAPGVEIIPTWDHLGMRATVSHRVDFTDVAVADDHVLGLCRPEDRVPDPGEAMLALWNALSIATIYDGVARAARDWLKTYLWERVPANLGAPLATLPRVQEKFGEIEALLQVSRTLIDTAAADADAGTPPDPVRANIVKHVATDHAIRAVALGLELTGNPGISRANPLERHYRDVLCSRIHSPQADMILTAAGRAGLAR